MNLKFWFFGKGTVSKQQDKTTQSEQTKPHHHSIYSQSEQDVQCRERRMKLTGLFMSIAMAALAGTITAVTTEAVDIEDIVLVPAAVEAVLLLFLWLTARYELQDWQCFAQHSTEIEYQSTATQAEEYFKGIFKYLPLMLHYPLLAFGANCLIKYCTITVPYMHISMICFAITVVIKWLMPKLQEQYASGFDVFKTFALLTAITMMCAYCI